MPPVLYCPRCITLYEAWRLSREGAPLEQRDYRMVSGHTLAIETLDPAQYAAEHQAYELLRNHVQLCRTVATSQGERQLYEVYERRNRGTRRQVPLAQEFVERSDGVKYLRGANK